MNTQRHDRGPRRTGFTAVALATALLTGIIAGDVRATQVDVGLVVSDGAPACDEIEIDLILSSTGSAQPIDAVDAVLLWDPEVLELIGPDEAGPAAGFFHSGFLSDPDGINDDFGDGDAIFTALANPGTPVMAPPAPDALIVIRIRFGVLTASDPTTVTLVDAMGAFAETRVLLNGLNLTGDLVSVALPAIACHPADVNGDGVIGFADLLLVLSNWGPCGGCAADIDQNGVVGFSDLLLVLANWGL